LLIAVLSLLATGTAALAASPPPDTKTTIVRVEDDDGGINTTTLLESAVSGLVALGGVGIGVKANRRLERDRAEREQDAEQSADIDALVDAITAVTNRLPVFQSGKPQEADVLGLQADVSAVRDARERVQDVSLRGAVDVFSVAAQAILRDPTPGNALSDQIRAASGAADMVKARAKEAKEALRA